MTFLPIVARELRVAARKRSTYWIRFAAAALALAVCAWTFLFFMRLGATNMAGRMLFGGGVGLAWLYAVMGGIFKTADALSEEKREGTLGLLFLTDLKGYDIVLGKIVAASVNWFFGLLALFPIIALSLLMGGVAPGEFWRKIFALANLLFYSLALGMFVSSFSRNERRAAGLTIALLVLLLWGPASLAEEIQKAAGARNPTPWLVLPDVTSPLRFGSDVGYARNPEFYWQSLGVSHMVGWLFIVLASVIVPRTWQQPAGKLARWQEQAGQLAYGRNTLRRKLFRERALAVTPFYWVAARARGQSTLVWIVLLLSTGGFAISYLFDYNSGWSQGMMHIFCAISLHSILKAWIALAACRRFVDDRRSGALELILSTPLAPGEIIRGQWRAILRQFGGPTLFVLAIDIILVCLALETPGLRSGNGRLMFILTFAAGMIVLVADMIALAWLSMWRGLKARHSYTAWLWCVVQLLVLPWILFYVGFTAFLMIVFMPQAIAGRTTALQAEVFPYIVLGLWFVLCMGVAILSFSWARHRLGQHFRQQVTQSFAQPQPVSASSTESAPPKLTSG